MTEQLRDRVGRFGIWRASAQVTTELATAIEQAGFGTLWLGGSPKGDLAQADELLPIRCRSTRSWPGRWDYDLGLLSGG